MNSAKDTIVAIATPLGEGGISVIRISGYNAIEIADKGFQGKSKLVNAKTHTAHVGYFVNMFDEIVDEIVAVIFREPHSYTSENVVELSCHGGTVIARAILGELVHYGARLANPGEFTLRAFLNGRIDLSQAEAVADLVQSRSEISRKASLFQLRGNLSSRINTIRDHLLDMCSKIEAELDFVEEGLNLYVKDNMLVDLNEVMISVDELIKSYDQGRLIRNGARVVLVGRTNVGKSSIFNKLLDKERAIVTKIPGTTRDTIEENLIIQGMLLTLVDTAGIRDSTDLAEIEGFKRTRNEIANSDIILFVIDASEEAYENDKIILKTFPNIIGKKLLIVLNKVDLVADEFSYGNFAQISDFPIVYVSAKTGSGFNKLETMFIEMLTNVDLQLTDSTIVVTNLRHKECLETTMKSLRKAYESLISKIGNEFISIDMRNALNSLCEITGKITTTDILNNIFSKFCVGK